MQEIQIFYTNAKYMQYFTGREYVWYMYETCIVNINKKIKISNVCRMNILTVTKSTIPSITW